MELASNLSEEQASPECVVFSEAGKEGRKCHERGGDDGEVDLEVDGGAEDVHCAGSFSQYALFSLFMQYRGLTLDWELVGRTLAGL